MKPVKQMLSLLILTSAVCSIAAWWDLSSYQKKEDEKGSESTPRRDTPQGNQQKEAPREVDRSPSEPQDVEIDDIEKELNQVIQRSSQLKTQVQTNRVEVHKILERAQIHEKILRSMRTPKPTVVQDRIKIDQILAQEKLRLIAQEARRNQDRLRAIQHAQTAQAVRTSPIRTKAS